MRHHNAKTRFGRERKGRVALMRSLARSLILKGGIVTTTTKAKALRPFVERLITAGKTASLASRRSVLQKLASSDAAAKIHSTISPRFAKRAGGYTRIIRIGKVGQRNVEMSRIEFVE